MSRGRKGLPTGRIDDWATVPLTEEEADALMATMVCGFSVRRAWVVPDYTVTTSSGRAEDWVPAEWEKVAAREAWRAVLERERIAAVLDACAAALGHLEGMPAERTGRPVTAVALVLGLR